ncbi:MAG: hypothetical protein FWC12_12380 [Treponema sp.]|nr:hypothetical protein [Treponema sp.]
MNDTIIKLIEIGIQILIPIVIVIMGLLLSRKLDKEKNNFELEKEWRIKWADAFYDVAYSYNNIITDCVMEIFKTDQVLNSNDSNKDIEIKKHDMSLLSLFRDLEKLNYKIDVFMCFNTKNSIEIKKLTNEILTSFQKYCSERKFNFDTFKKEQSDLNYSFRNAHNELLNSKIDYK